MLSHLKMIKMQIIMFTEEMWEHLIKTLHHHRHNHEDHRSHLSGCVFVELVKGEALWPGKSDVDQLYLIRFNNIHHCFTS